MVPLVIPVGALQAADLSVREGTESMEPPFPAESCAEPPGRRDDGRARIIEHGGGHVDQIELVAAAKASHQGQEFLFDRLAHVAAQAEQGFGVVEAAAGVQQLSIAAGGRGGGKFQAIEGQDRRRLAPRSDSEASGTAGCRHQSPENAVIHLHANGLALAWSVSGSRGTMVRLVGGDDLGLIAGQGS
jgi:hypothetical protein